MMDQTFKMELTKEQVECVINASKVKQAHQDEVNKLNYDIECLHGYIAVLSRIIGYDPVEPSGKKMIGINGFIIFDEKAYILDDIIKLAESYMKSGKKRENISDE